MKKDETNHIESPDEEYVDANSIKWYSDDFKLPDKKGPVAFFNGLNHKVVLDWDFNASEIAEAVDEIYTDFEFFDIESLSPILANRKDHERFRALASEYIDQYLLKSLYELFGKIASDSLKYALCTIAEEKEPKRVTKQIRLDIDRLANKIERMMKDRQASGPGRPDDTGTFKSKKDFLVVLQFGFDHVEGKPTKDNVWAKMREHELFIRKETKVGTLDTFIKEAGFENWTEAKKKLYKPNKSAKK